MSIIRTPKQRNYVSVCNELAQDSRLSFEARGVMLYLLSKPPDWEVQFSDIERQGNFGRERRKRILAELEKAGYFTREMKRQKGKFEYDYQVHETPQTQQPSTGEPRTGYPSTVEPSPEKPSIYKEQKEQKTDRQKQREKTLCASPAQTRDSEVQPLRRMVFEPQTTNRAAQIFHEVFPQRGLANLEIETMEADMPTVNEKVWRETLREWHVSGYSLRNIIAIIDKYNSKLQHQNQHGTKQSNGEIYDDWNQLASSVLALPS